MDAVPVDPARPARVVPATIVVSATDPAIPARSVDFAIARANIVSENDLTTAAALLDVADARRRESATGTVAPFSGISPTSDSAKLLESKLGPVAQKDRAAVS